MQTLIDIGVVLLAYVLGSIPFGLLIVKVKTGKDLREVESGRTGGTNAMRAAGCLAGILTTVLDILKGTAAVLVAQRINPGNHWLHVLAPIAAILGHNYSIFLPEINDQGRFVRLRGGAGGAPAAGGALGLWPGVVVLGLPLTVLTFLTFGIASVTTMSVPLFVFILYSWSASQGLLPSWIYVWYPVLAGLLLIWALRPNIRKLVAGQERVVKYSLYGKLRERRDLREAGQKK